MRPLKRIFFIFFPSLQDLRRKNWKVMEALNSAQSRVNNKFGVNVSLLLDTQINLTINF